MGMEGQNMKEMVVTLAELSNDHREAMLSERLRLFASQSDEERKMGMRMMLEAALDLPQEKYAKIAETRIKLIPGFEEVDRMKLMKTHVSVVKELPEDKRLKEMKTVMSIVTKLPEEKRMMMMALMDEAGMMKP